MELEINFCPICGRKLENARKKAIDWLKNIKLAEGRLQWKKNTYVYIKEN